MTTKTDDELTYVRVPDEGCDEHSTISPFRGVDPRVFALQEQAGKLRKEKALVEQRLEHDFVDERVMRESISIRKFLWVFMCFLWFGTLCLSYSWVPIPLFLCMACFAFMHGVAGYISHSLEKNLEPLPKTRCEALYTRASEIASIISGLATAGLIGIFTSLIGPIGPFLFLVIFLLEQLSSVNWDRLKITFSRARPLESRETLSAALADIEVKLHRLRNDPAHQEEITIDTPTTPEAKRAKP